MTEPEARRNPPPDDPAVEAEWRKIEQERIAEEVEEAREDLLDAGATPGRRWSWTAVAIALAAGVVVAVLLNSPWFRRAVDPGQPGVEEATAP